MIFSLENLVYIHLTVPNADSNWIQSSSRFSGSPYLLYGMSTAKDWLRLEVELGSRRCSTPALHFNFSPSFRSWILVLSPIVYKFKCKICGPGLSFIFMSFLLLVAPASWLVNFFSKMNFFLRCISIATLGLILVKAQPYVTLPAGTVHGTTCSNGAGAFLSIPFAIPPVGDLRWTAPQAYNQTFPADGYNATTRSAACIQFGDEFTEPGATSEDWYVFVSL